jgi:hypothetical protein
MLIITLSEPGGYLQWMEGDIPRYISRILDHGSDITQHPNMYALEKVHMSQMEIAEFARSITWITDLGKHFEKHGLQNVNSTIYHVEKKYWRAWTETLLLILEEMAFQLDQPELKDLVERAGMELVAGAVRLMPISVAIGQKPSA